MNDNNEIYNQMIAEINAINNRAEERAKELKSIFDELNKAIDAVLVGGVVCG